MDSYKDGKNRFYTILIPEGEYLAFENKQFLNKVNNNSVTTLVASLFQSKAITQEDLAELAEFIQEKAKEEER